MNLGAKSGRPGTANREQQEAMEQTLMGATCKSGMGPLGAAEGTGWAWDSRAFWRRPQSWVWMGLNFSHCSVKNFVREQGKASSMYIGH